jgi:hypothetical protein
VCGGAHADLARARRRATLVADSFGIATTHVQAAPNLCGQLLLQAVDEDSCLTTDVVGIPATVVP